MSGNTNSRGATAGPALTAGIDMAASPRRRGFCVIEWEGAGARLADLGVGCADQTLVALIERCHLTGVDVPLGWPLPFVEMVATTLEDSRRPFRDFDIKRLRFRLTDLYVRQITGRPPLSVSSDLIAIPAFHMQAILRSVGPYAADRVIEAYPAAALARWGLPSFGYKGSRGAGTREQIVRELMARLQSRISVSPSYKDLLLRYDDALDAFVCGLVARAWQLGLCDPPPKESDAAEVCAREGWIAVPVSGSLESLC